MKKLYVIHENPKWMEPLRLAFERNNLAFEEWDLSERGLIDLDDYPPEGVFLNRISPSSHIRGHKYSIYYTFAVLNWLEKHRKKVINGTPNLQMEISKVAQYNALQQAQIKTPKTIAAFSKEDIKTAALKIGFPIILKHNWGGSGAGVYKFINDMALDKYLNSNSFEDSMDGITLVQQYIESTESYITRAEFIGGKFVYAVKINSEDSFNLCPADSCSVNNSFCPTGKNSKFNIIDFDHPIIRQYENFLKQHNLMVAGIEFIIDKSNNLYTYDINANTNYNSEAERIAGISAGDILALFLANLLAS